MSLSIYIENINGEASNATIGEIIAHELALHGNKYEQYIDAILKGKSKSYFDQISSKDHDALEKSDNKNKSYQIYKSVMDQLIKIDPNYKKAMENDKNKAH